MIDPFCTPYSICLNIVASHRAILHGNVAFSILVLSVKKHNSNSGKVKHELRVTSYEFKSTRYDFKFTSYEFKSMSYEFKSTSYKIKSMS